MRLLLLRSKPYSRRFRHRESKSEISDPGRTSILGDCLSVLVDRNPISARIKLESLVAIEEHDALLNQWQYGSCYDDSATVGYYQGDGLDEGV